MNKKILLIAALLPFILFSCSKKADWQGIPAPQEPIQNTLELPKPFEYKEHAITPLANYSVTGVVLSTKRYRFDREASLSPVDIAVGWKHMSDAEVLNKLKIDQRHRWYIWRAPEGYPIQKELIERSSANEHCVPATPQIKKALLKIKKHDLVTIKGYLISAEKQNWKWTSSLTRNDTGSNSCELIWVTEVSSSKL